MTIKAIPTRYKGYHFRSRLEARWAVCFDSLGLSWRYETEGISLPGNAGYLPDFYMADWDAYIEIKPSLPYEDFVEEDQVALVCSPDGEYTKTGKFIAASELLADRKGDAPRQRLMMLCGEPWLPRLELNGERWKLIEGYIGLTLMLGEPIIDVVLMSTDDKERIDWWPLYREGNVQFTSEPERRELTSVVFPRGQMNRIYVGRGRRYNSQRLLNAYRAARSARFEHGESGAT